MTKKIGFIALMVLIILSFLIINLNSGEKTIKEALPSHGSQPISIIHEEKTDKGIIVFYNHLGKDDLSVAIVKKNLLGYKTVYSGTQGNLKLVLSKFGLSTMYYPAIENTSPPVYLGIIGDDSISQVKVLEKKRSIESHAKIINVKDTRIWLAFMDEFQGSKFEIIALSKDGKAVTSINEDISPWHVEQEPFKDTYN